MPCVGFVDSAGDNITFDDVMAGLGDFRTRAGAPLPTPLVRMLARQMMPHDANYYGLPEGTDCVSVTTLISPIQKVMLERRHDYFTAPLDSLWSAYGTMMHLMLESGADPDGGHAEQRHVIDLGGTHLGGTLDHLEDGTGSDWKVTGAYKVKLMVRGPVEVDGREIPAVYYHSPDYFWQGNLYAWMARKAGHATDAWQLVTIVRDWSERYHGRDIGPVEVIPIPLLSDERVENYVQQRLTIYRAAQLCDDAGLPECTDDERWLSADGRTNRRCEQWCSAAPFCGQWAKLSAPKTRKGK